LKEEKIRWNLLGNMTNERMSEAEQMTLLMSLQREMTEMKKMNEEDILALRRENEEIKKKLS